jgi:hypothetical protein
VLPSNDHSAHLTREPTGSFIKKLVLWKNIEDRKYDCFETFETFVIENDVKLADGIITEISAHLNALKKKRKTVSR